MAQRITLVDDIDGTPITPGRGGTVTFSIDDDTYEIDLSGNNTGRLHRALAPFIASAHTANGPRTRSRVTAIPASAGRKSPEMLAAIRHWATRNGYEVPRSGRIPAHIQTAYDANH